jgi:hypothetical protein
MDALARKNILTRRANHLHFSNIAQLFKTHMALVAQMMSVHVMTHWPDPHQQLSASTAVKAVTVPLQEHGGA